MHFIIIVLFSISLFDIQYLSPSNKRVCSAYEHPSEEYVNGFEKAKEKVSKWTQLVKQRVHSTVLDHVTTNMVPSLRLLVGNSLVARGLVVTANNGKKHFNLTNGVLTRLDTLQYTGSSLIKEEKNETEFMMQFAFQNLLLKYTFEYVSTKFFLKRKKSGRVVLLFKQPTEVIVEATVPENIKSILGDAKRSGECYLTTKSVNVTAAPCSIRRLKVWDDTLRVTRSSVRILLGYLMEDLRVNMVEVLQDKVEWAVKSLDSVCRTESEQDASPSHNTIADGIMIR